jgi:hypothetical protein
MPFLKADCLLITGKMFSNIPGLHTHPIYMSQKVINLVVWMSSPIRITQHWILTGEKGLEMFMPFLCIFSENSIANTATADWVI